AVTASTDHAALHHPAVANPVRVRVEPHTCLVKPADGEPFVIEPPATVTSCLGRPRAVDQFVLKAKKGQKLAIRAESLDLGLSVSAVVRVADHADKELARAEPPGLHTDPQLSFDPPTDGDYHITVRDLYGAG